MMNNIESSSTNERFERVSKFESAAKLVLHKFCLSGAWRVGSSRGGRKHDGSFRWYCLVTTLKQNKDSQSLRFNGYVLWVNNPIRQQDVALVRILCDTIADITGQQVKPGDELTYQRLQEAGILN